jgi:hypothetical protein
MNPTDAALWQTIFAGLNFAALLATLIVLVFYTFYTYRMQQAAQAQAKAMQESLAQTQKIIEQNARAVEASETQAVASKTSAEAAEQSAKTAREAFYLGEHAYFGIAQITVGDLVAGRYPRVVITFINGGKTPAWHFNAWFVGLSLSHSPSDEGIWTITAVPYDIGNSFFPSGADKSITYDQADHVITQEEVDAINKQVLRLFVLGSAHYVDMGGERQAFNYCAVYDPKTRKCSDFYV